VHILWLPQWRRHWDATYETRAWLLKLTSSFYSVVLTIENHCKKPAYINHNTQLLYRQCNTEPEIWPRASVISIRKYFHLLHSLQLLPPTFVSPLLNSSPYCAEALASSRPHPPLLDLHGSCTRHLSVLHVAPASSFVQPLSLCLCESQQACYIDSYVHSIPGSQVCESGGLGCKYEGLE